MCNYLPVMVDLLSSFSLPFGVVSFYAVFLCNGYILLLRNNKLILKLYTYINMQVRVNLLAAMNTI